MSFIKGYNSAPHSCFRTQRERCAALHFHALLSRDHCTNKASNSIYKAVSETTAVCKSDVKKSLSASRSFKRDRFVKNVLLAPTLFTRGCFCFRFPETLVPLHLHFPPHWRVLAPSSLFVFTPPPYLFLFWPSSGSSWFSLMCWGNAAPWGIPPPPTHSLISLSPTDTDSHYP